MCEAIRRGAFIVLEGCDRCGKTTQSHKLVEALTAAGIKAEGLRFPERTTAIGKAVSDYLERKAELEDHAVHLLFAANRWEAVPKMKELLMGGTTLIVDRYSYSGVAFSAAKTNMDLDWCIQPEVGLPRPDAVLYLTLSPEEAAKRAAFGGERYEETGFQRTVAKNYNILKSEDWKVVDASKNIEDLHSELLAMVKGIIEGVGDRGLGVLWADAEGPGDAKRPRVETSQGKEQRSPVG